MNELLIKLAECIEFGKINMASPYPPQMKGQEGADEITRRALEEGVPPQDILSNGLMPGMERIGVKFRENKVFVPQVLMSAKAMSTKGIVFPRMNSKGRIGVTKSCSMVPISFSRTAAMLVKSRETMVTIIAMMPGM